VGEAIFGDPSVWGLSQVDPTWPAWAIAMGGHVPPHELIDRIVDRYVRAGSNLDAFGYDAAEIARGVSGAWLRDTVPDASLQHALEALTRRLEGYERMPHELLTSAPARMLFARDHTATLLGLAPAVRFADRRPALRDALRRLASRLGRSVEANTAAADDDPAVFAAAAAALGLTESTPSPRALEFLRRASRGFVQSADEAFLESGEGDPLARIAPSSLYALAVVSTGDRITAFAVARTLARMARGSGRWTLQARSLATALLERLTPDRAPDVRGTVRVVIDGHATDAPLEHGVASASSRTLSLPGRHTVEVSLPAGTTLIAEAEARYGRPWTDVPAARAPLAMTLDGPIGSRDGRAALVLRVQNRGPRVIASPVVEIDLPAGAEIDEDARREIQRRVAHAPVITERTLVLTLRAMAPGGATRIPLPIRWSVGGSLHGLGVGAYVTDQPGASAAVLPSRVVTVADEASEAPAGGSR
jgi:hypothetical protein